MERHAAEQMEWARRGEARRSGRGRGEGGAPALETPFGPPETCHAGGKRRGMAEGR